MTLGGTGHYNLSGNLGTTTVRVEATRGVSYNNTNGAVNWILDGTGITFGNQNNTQSGQITVSGNSTITSLTDYSGKTTTLNGKITGSGTLTLISHMTRSYALGVILNAANDYSGGTKVTDQMTKAAVARRWARATWKWHPARR